MPFTSGSDIFTWVILPLLIFISRIFDVSIGTLRIMFVSRGDKVLSPILGFFEVLIWLIAMGQIMQNLDNVMCYFAYAGGFAAGNFVGIRIEEKLAMGMYGIRIFAPKEASEKLKERFSESGFGVTILEGQGAKGQMVVLYSIFKRKDREKVLDIISERDEKLFYSIEEIKAVKEGIFPSASNRRKGHFRLMRNRK